MFTAWLLVVLAGGVVYQVISITSEGFLTLVEQR